MSNEIIAAIIQSIAMIVAVVLGFAVTRKTKKIEWYEEQAKAFLVCSRNYSETVSKLFVTLFILFSESKQNDDEKKRLEKTLYDSIRDLQLLGWEIKRHALSAQEAKEQFLKQEADLFAALSKIIGQVSVGGAGGKVDLEKMRSLQNAFDESARKLHAVLCTLK